jgi:hypothetical protein
VVVKAEWHAGEMFPRVGLIVTNLKGHTKKVVRFELPQSSWSPG